MKKFHRNLNIMSIFTAAVLVLAILFWRIFMNIASSNVFLNGIIVGTTIFGVLLCFVEMFRLLPEYKWMHAYFEGRKLSNFVPRLLHPVSMALNNKHSNVSMTQLTEIIDLTSARIEDERDSIRYVTNTLILLGLLGTFWGLIITIGGFASLLNGLDFNNPAVLMNMQMRMAVPLSGMATAFTSSLLGLAGSLIVGFLGLQLQFAQNTILKDLTDFLSRYTLKKPETEDKMSELIDVAPVNENTYTKISDIYDSLTGAGYDVIDLIRLDSRTPAVVALGTDERLFLGVANANSDLLSDVLKRFELCFADTLEDIQIDIRILALGGSDSYSDDKIVHFASIESMNKYLRRNQNIAPETKSEMADFDAYKEYIQTTIKYLFKPNK